MDQKPNWNPRVLRVGPFVLAATRAVSGEWTKDGRPLRLHLERSRGPGWHLIVGAWCLSAALVSTIAR